MKFRTPQELVSEEMRYDAARYMELLDPVCTTTLDPFRA